MSSNYQIKNTTMFYSVHDKIHSDYVFPYDENGIEIQNFFISHVFGSVKRLGDKIHLIEDCVLTGNSYDILKEIAEDFRNNVY